MFPLRFGKTGNKKRATCLATLLQNELNSDVVRFITHIKPVLQQIRLLTGLNVGQWALTIFMENPEIPGRIQMERLIPVEIFWHRKQERDWVHGVIYKIPVKFLLSLDKKPGTSNPNKWYRKFRSFR